LQIAIPLPKPDRRKCQLSMPEVFLRSDSMARSVHKTLQIVTDSALLAAVTLSVLRPWCDTLVQRHVSDLSRTETDNRRLLNAIADGLGWSEAERGKRFARARVRAETALARGREAGLHVLDWRAASYPDLLRHIPDPPLVLWAKGEIAHLDRPAVAVVGSRMATPAGVAVASRLGGELSAAGLVVVSGMARGIDGAAHRGALDAGGRTIAVLGCGADVVYPPEHGPLATDIAAAGVVVSEFPPGTLPLPRHFPLRNRIISGLSKAVVVVEAHERSGSLITARAALEQGRDVLAVPGSVASGRYRGAHALIKDGARLVETVEDVLDQIGWRRTHAPASRDVARDSLQLQGLEETMATGEPYTLDDLLTRTGRPAPAVLAELGALEVAGRIRRMTGGHFVRLD
jgi:DNA processing protein